MDEKFIDFLKREKELTEKLLLSICKSFYKQNCVFLL